MPKKFSLPEELFVYRQQDGDDSYLMVDEDLVESIETADDENTIIGTYKLVTEGKYSIDKTITEL